MRIVRYLIGLVALGAVMYIIIFKPLPILFYPGLPFSMLFRRVIFILLLSAIFCLYRICCGPTAPDRIVAIDILGILIIGFCAVLGIPTGRGWYIDIGIAWALQSFISTLALAKYLEGRGFDE